MWCQRNVYYFLLGMEKSMTKNEKENDIERMCQWQPGAPAEYSYCSQGFRGTQQHNNINSDVSVKFVLFCFLTPSLQEPFYSLMDKKIQQNVRATGELKTFLHLSVTWLALRPKQKHSSHI